MRFDCAGCAIVRGNTGVPGGVIYDGNIAILAADPEVPIPGFLVVTSKRHVRSLSELSNEECHEIIDIIFHAEKALKSLGITEITLVQEERSSHLHFWIFPNYDWMTKNTVKELLISGIFLSMPKRRLRIKIRYFQLSRRFEITFNDCGIKTEA